MSASPSEIKAFFQENGYYVQRGVFSPAEIKELETDFDQIVRQLTNSGENIDGTWKGQAMDKIAPKGSTVIVHTHNVQIYSAKWLRAMLHPKFLEIATAILGPDVILHHSKLFQKPAEKGSPFPVHQDWSYFPFVKDSMIAGVVMVSRATDEMGCMRVVPGSHKLGRINETDGTLPSDVLDKYPLQDALPIEAEPGDVMFFHYFTLHGSMPNRSPEIRKSVLVQLHAGDDTPEPDGPAHPYARLVLAGHNPLAKRSHGEKS
jgi:ectoine hydroxylase-related dioxygenase (phytanoyl-CoA dioxygenase family)